MADGPNDLRDDSELRDLLTLRLTRGLGPVRIARLVSTLGSASAVLGSSPSALQAAPGIGPKVARDAAAGFREAETKVDDELSLIEDAGATPLIRGRAEYPPLLDELDDAPPVLLVRGRLAAAGRGEPDAYPVAMVGSRGCTAYGIEQAERFGGVLGRSGLTIVSGGARGIDTAAHRGALRSGGRTVVVMGCGLAKVYPPENRDLFESIVREGRGAVVSELPMLTEPAAENFPARNRIISGLSLGVVVIEASAKSGALITARLAAEEHGREVLAVPGRVDSPSSAGSNSLIRDGGAGLVTDPREVIDALENAARHRFGGTHDAISRDPSREPTSDGAARAAGSALRPERRRPESQRGTATAEQPEAATISRERLAALPADQQQILLAMSETDSLDGLANETGLGAAGLRSALTMLELAGFVERRGTRVIRRGSIEA